MSNYKSNKKINSVFVKLFNIIEKFVLHILIK